MFPWLSTHIVARSVHPIRQNSDLWQTDADRQTTSHGSYHARVESCDKNEVRADWWTADNSTSIADTILFQDEAIVDIRFHSGAAPWWVYATVIIHSLLSHYCVAYSWPLCTNMTSSIKLELHNISWRRHRRTEPQAQGSCKCFLSLSIQSTQFCSLLLLMYCICVDK